MPNEHNSHCLYYGRNNYVTASRVLKTPQVTKTLYFYLNCVFGTLTIIFFLILQNETYLAHN